MSIRFMLLALSLAASPLSATVVFLHGSFAANSTWYRPEGAFYEEVAKHAPEKKQTLSSFSWSGKFTSKAIIEDAGELVKYLLTLPPGEEISIIAHSNGGNVTAYATIILAELYQAMGTAIEQVQETRSVHVPQRLYAPFIQIHQTKMHEKKCIIDTEVEKQITELYSTLRTNLLHRSPQTSPINSFFIKEIFLLGTPINENTFCPDMSIVGHLYNLYSEGDFVQPIAGHRHLSDHERIANLHVAMHQVVPHCLDCTDEMEENGVPVAPCHECIHAPLVGRWLLDIPNTVRFYNAHSDKSILKDGMLWLDHEQKPQYQPNPFFDRVQPERAVLQIDQDQSDN